MEIIKPGRMQSTSIDYGDFILKDLGHHHYEKVKGYHG